jgi:hypothetical protein
LTQWLIVFDKDDLNLQKFSLMIKAFFRIILLISTAGRATFGKQAKFLNKRLILVGAKYIMFMPGLKWLMRVQSGP